MILIFLEIFQKMSYSHFWFSKLVVNRKINSGPRPSQEIYNLFQKKMLRVRNP